MLLSNKQVRRRWSARAQGNHFAIADGMEVGTVATLWDTQNRKYDKVSLLYMPAPISSSVNMLFCFHCVCVRFAQLIWRIGAKPPTATFGNVTGCGRQMGSLALPSSVVFRVSDEGEGVYVYMSPFACCHDRHASL